MNGLNAQFELLGRLISASDMRQRVISHNLANVNTPNYQRLEVAFEKELAGELKHGAKPGHSAEPVIRSSGAKAVRADGNTVDIDLEIGELNKNALLQQIYLQLLGTEMSQMRLAIEGS